MTLKDSKFQKVGQKNGIQFQGPMFPKMQKHYKPR